MKVYKNQGMWNLIDQQGILVVRGTWGEVKERLKEYWP